ncbi:MAG: hypothetical protein QOG43_2906 [Actinomycetota bacterium]|jgi:hypothetical protein|nr:hypothetical protein [Actinomycetota bacterium]
MVRIVLDLAVDTDPADVDRINSDLDAFVARLREHGPVSVARAHITASPDPDQAQADMVEAFRGV